MYKHKEHGKLDTQGPTPFFFLQGSQSDAMR